MAKYNGSATGAQLDQVPQLIEDVSHVKEDLHSIDGRVQTLEAGGGSGGGGGTSITVDTALSTTSANPVQNKAVAKEIGSKTQIPAPYNTSLWVAVFHLISDVNNKVTESYVQNYVSEAMNNSFEYITQMLAGYVTKEELGAIENGTY